MFEEIHTLHFPHFKAASLSGSTDLIKAARHPINRQETSVAVCFPYMPNRNPIVPWQCEAPFSMHTLHILQQRLEDFVAVLGFLSILFLEM